jgi:hypothetical protein
MYTTVTKLICVFCLERTCRNVNTNKKLYVPNMHSWHVKRYKASGLYTLILSFYLPIRQSKYLFLFSSKVIFSRFDLQSEVPLWDFGFSLRQVSNLYLLFLEGGEFKFQLDETHNSVISTYLWWLYRQHHLGSCTSIVRIVSREPVFRIPCRELANLMYQSSGPVLPAFHCLPQIAHPALTNSNPVI